MYRSDPGSNLSVGAHPDAVQFGRFADLSGRVLDMGCGPQDWPTYFDPHAPGTQFAGIDPLIADAPSAYPRVRALAEFCPFVDNAFDRVLLATTLDHFVDPRAALVEAARVLKRCGFIAVWLGYKRADAPPPAVSNPVYESLTTPAGAEDLFHVQRMGRSDAVQLFTSVGLEVSREEEHEVDQYRTNYFFGLTAGMS